MTVSIVARDPATGQIGVATASFSFAVGATVPQLCRGVGGAAIQAWSPLAWGREIFDRLADGGSAVDVRDVLAARAQAGVAQVVIIDNHGGVAALSGDQLEPEAGHAYGAGVCAAANLMEHTGVPDAAIVAYRASTAQTLSGRLLDALAEADRLGGDIRGRQAAAIRIASPAQDGQGDLDLRVDDARQPIAELRRLHQIAQSHTLLAAARDTNGVYQDIDLLHAALATAPDDQACLGALGLALLRSGRLAHAIPILQRLHTIEPRTTLRIQRLMTAGHLDETIARAALAALEPDI